MSALRPFSEVTAVAPAGDGVFDATVDPEWTIVGKPNGGYLLALCARAAVAVGGQPDVLAASATYLRAPDPGPVRVEAEALRVGRSASQVRARLVQGGAPCVEALLTTGRLDPGSSPYWDRGAPAFDRSGDVGDGVLLVADQAEGFRVAIMDQVDLRLDGATAGFRRGEPAGRGELAGWLSLPGQTALDPVSLLFAVDALPPATFDIAPSGWVPTLALTAYVRAVPADGPVRVLQRAHLIDGGRVDESCTVWDRTGRLVAQATQLAGIRLG